MELRIILVLLLTCMLVAAQGGTPVPQGSSIPGASAIPLGLTGPAFLEAGGGYSNLTDNFTPWKDAYIRGMISGGRNTLSGEAVRESRYSDTGWFFGATWTRTLGENWYSELHFGSSTVSGFFLPRIRTGGTINRKLLAHRQLVLTGGFGYDKSKTVNDAFRTSAGATYYFEHPFMLEGGVTWTLARPGSVLARTQYAAITQGHEKEHYISLRAEIGREGYELVGPQTSLFNFVIHDYSANWRQWIGPNWGVNVAYEHESNIAFRRNGGTLGLFFEF